MKDFVAKVGKSYEKANENTEESETLANKVRITCVIFRNWQNTCTPTVHSKSSKMEILISSHAESEGCGQNLCSQYCDTHGKLVKGAFFSCEMLNGYPVGYLSCTVTVPALGIRAVVHLKNE